MQPLQYPGEYLERIMSKNINFITSMMPRYDRANQGTDRFYTWNWSIRYDTTWYVANCEVSEHYLFISYQKPQVDPQQSSETHEGLEDQNQVFCYIGDSWIHAHQLTHPCPLQAVAQLGGDQNQLVSELGFNYVKDNWDHGNCHTKSDPSVSVVMQTTKWWEIHQFMY